MVNINKINVFAEELSHIFSNEIRAFTEKAISLLPDYFFEVAASSTGKYHPKYALGDGGLVRHTKAAVGIANSLLELEMYGRYSQDEKDLMIAALILHDGMKHGEEKQQYTVAKHPTVLAEWISKNPELNTLLPDEQLGLLMGAVSSHMGQWNTDYKTKEVILPKPITPFQKMVHMCDYLASRKFIEYDFGDTYYNPDDLKDTTADDLKNAITTIIAVFKEKIESGIDKDSIYDIIAELNNGKKNPNAIAELSVAQTILERLEAIC